MRITYMSDLHLEFGRLEQPLPKGDVLILAGDITLAGCLLEDELGSSAMRVKTATFDLFEEAKANFKRVFYFQGNHEPYNFNISETPKVLKKALPGVTLLDDKVVPLSDDVLLVGGTLWTDMNKGEAHDYIMGGLHSRMNDFNIVDINTKEGPRRFTTHDAVKRHAKTLRLIEKTAIDNPAKTIVVATHHAPSYKGLNPHHGGSTLNAGYASDLENFIASHPNIRFWIHGHTHVQTEYRIAQCRVMANCRGYVNRERCADDFDPDRWFDTDDVLVEKAA